MAEPWTSAPGVVITGRTEPYDRDRFLELVRWHEDRQAWEVRHVGNRMARGNPGRTTYIKPSTLSSKWVPATDVEVAAMFW